MARSIRFRYNPVFLPEYVSTVLISIPISAVFMTTPIGGGRAALRANPHLGGAIAIYLLIAGWLFFLTIRYRRRFGQVVMTSPGPNQAILRAGSVEMPISGIAECQESLGKFFGRLVRRVRLEDERGNSVTLSDAIFQFDALQSLLGELLPRDANAFPHDDPERVERVKVAWTERHEMFPASETLGDIFSRLSWRGVCLLPVAVVDVLINLVSILSLSKLQQTEYMVYSAPLSLLTSGFIARYVYYYMFTSTTMNKPLGTGGGQRRPTGSLLPSAS